MHAAYKTMHEWLTPALRATVQALLVEETVILFHCATGKDPAS